MKYRLLTGATAGIVISFWTAVHFHFFANLYWGVFPLVLGIIPFAAALLSGRPLLFGVLPSAVRRYLPAAVALLTPALLFAVYQMSDAMAFIDGTPGAPPLLLSILLYAVGAGLPLDALAAAESTSQKDGDRLPWLLLGAGFGSLAFTFLIGAVELPILWILQAVVAGALLIRFPKETSTPESPVVKKRQQPTLPSPWPVLRYVVPTILVFAIPYYLQVMTEIPGFSADSISRFPAAMLIALGLGWQVGLLTKRRGQGQQIAVVAFIIAGALLANLSGSWLSSWFPSIYTAYYQGTDASFSNQLFGLHLLGGLFFSALGLSLIHPKQGASLPAWILTAQLVVGIVLFLVFRQMFSFVWVGLGVGVLLAVLSLYMLLRVYRREMFWTIMAVIWLAHLYPLFTMGTPGFDNFFNPTNFEIVSEERTPAGRMTLLISRDYDDRFHAVFWNQQQALTQSSRAVQSDLYRMGHIPMLLAAENARVLTLGLGSSLPIEAVTMHHPASVECVEPEAAMLRLSKATERTSRPRPWLKDVIYHNERIESFLLRATSQYDVILSAEPLAQSAPSPAVLTEEYFASIASLLTQQGIFAQWLSVARMDLDAMRPVIAALLAVFPHAEMWISSPDPEIAMIGIVAAKQPFTKDQPSAARFERLFTSSSELRLHFLRMEMGSFPSLLSAYGTNRTGLERLASGSSTEGLFQQIQLRTNQDPQNIFLDVNTLLSSRTPPDRMLAGQADSIRSLTSALLEERPLVMRAKASVLAGDDTSAFRMLDEILVRTPRNEEAARVLSDLFLRQAAGYVGAEKYGPAVSLISRALQLAPVNTYLLRLLMISSFYIGDREAAGLSIDGIKRMDPSHAGFRDNQATIRARQGATDDALLLYENAITLDARNEEFYCNMASFHYSQNRTWEAIRVLDQAADRAYYPAKAWYLKGMFYAEQGKIKFAREAYEAYLKAASPLDPYLTDVLQRLVELKKFKER